MINYKFREYNSVLKSMLNEEDTIDNILVRYLDSKPSQKEKKLLNNPEEWAKYAFENESQYYVTFYNQDGEPFACVNYSLLDIDVSFLEKNNKGELVKYLWLVFNRYDMQYYFKTDQLKPYPNNKLFLSQVESYSEDYKHKNTYKALFKRNEKLIKVSSAHLTKDPKSYRNEKKEAKVNLSHNYLEPPRHYLDYEHLFDYNEILKPEYLDVPLNQKDYIFKDGNRYYKDEQGNLIENN